MTNQNDIEAIMISHKQGIITADQANVEIVRMEKVRVVSKLHASVRSALNSAVKNGELRHKKKDGLKPEVYYHPDFEHLANDERSQIEREAIIAIAKVHIQYSYTGDGGHTVHEADKEWDYKYEERLD